jgi:radical SAM protein with 4Fe4S-binding SPASM domain
MSIVERQKKITKIPLEYLKEELPAPKSMKIEIVPRCNYRCQYCAICFRTEPVKDMPWELFEKITREATTLGVEEIGVFYIGESFMNPSYLVRAIRFLKSELRVPYVFLTSNASLADPIHVEACMDAGLDSLKWSCNAAGHEQFEELMGVNKNWYGRAYDNIKAAWEIRESGNYRTKLAASSIKLNEEQIAKMSSFKDSCIAPYVDEYYWLPLYTAGGQAIEKETELGFQPIAGNTGRLDDPSEPIPCWTIFTAAHIMADGKMTACCLDGVGNWVMGDLKTQSFMEAWNSPEFKELRKAHLKKDIIGTKCEKCALVS